MEEASRGRSQGSVQPDAKAGSGENLSRCFLLGQEAADERAEPGSSAVAFSVSILRSHWGSSNAKNGWNTRAGWAQHAVAVEIAGRFLLIYFFNVVFFTLGNDTMGNLAL